MRLTRWQTPETTAWDPFTRLSTLRDEIDRLFDSPYSALSAVTQPFLSGWLPAVDLFEDKDQFILKAELPGMKKEDIEVSLHEGVLSLSGERKTDDKYTNAEVCRSERFLGRFQRSLALPTLVNPEKVQATYKDGILTVTVAKAEEAKPKQIAINIK
jgi:HSP20 family protein